MFSRAAVATFLAVPFFARTAIAGACTRQYTVQDGDICDSISAMNKVSTHQLAVVNPAINPECSNLEIGQILCLGTQNEDCQIVHVVQLGDTCDLLTDNYKINSTVFFNNNPQVFPECTNLYTGEVVCVAPTIFDPAPSDGTSAASTSQTVTEATTLTVSPTQPPATPAANPHTTTATPASQPSSPTDEDDDEDCSEDEDVTSQQPTSTSHSKPSATSTPDDSDDEDLPYCSEDEDEED